MKARVPFFLLSLLSAFGSACSPPGDPENAASLDHELTRNDVAYRFETKATFGPQYNRFAVGPSREGAVIVAIDGRLAASRARTFVWNGTSLTEHAGTSPDEVSGSMAYDPTTGTTYFLEAQGDGTEYEALYSWNGSGWTQLLVQRTTRARSKLYFDTRANKLMRLSKWGVEEYREAETYSSRPRGFYPHDERTYRSSLVAYDDARGALVIYGEAANGTWSVDERRLAATPWAPAEWTSMRPAVEEPPNTYGSCSSAFFDPTNARTVRVCRADWELTGFGYEWDGTTMRYVKMIGDAPTGHVPSSVAFDLVHGAPVAATYSPSGGVLQIARRQTETTPNVPPTLHAMSRQFTIYATEPASLMLAGADADFDPVTVSVSDPPAGATFDGRTLSFTPAVTDEGTRLLHLTVSDGEANVPATSTVEIKVVRYDALPADVRVEKDFWFHGNASLRGDERGAQLHARCTYSGRNPGAVRGRCLVETEHCTGGSFPSAGACTTRAVQTVVGEGVLSTNGSLYQWRREERSCADQLPSDPMWCPRWTSTVSARLDAAGNVCLGVEFEIASFRHGYTGRARTTGSSCP